MRLAHKLSLTQFCLIVFILLAYGALQFVREVRLFESDMVRDHHVTGVALCTAVAGVWQHAGPEEALKVVRQANTVEQDIDIGWIPLPAATVDPAGDRADWTSVVRSGHELTRVERDVHGAASRVTYVPVRMQNGIPGALRISESLEEERAFVRQTLLRILAGTALIAAGGLVISLRFGAVWIVRPMESLVGFARRIGAGDLSLRAPVRSHDEVGVLAQEMNQMADQLESGRDRIDRETRARIAALSQLRHADRLVTVGTLASGIAHELGTPLNVVSARARMIETAVVSADAVPDNARIIREQTERITRIVRQLLDFSRRGDGQAKSVGDLCEIVRQTLAMLAPYAHKHAAVLRFTEDGPAPIRVWMDREHIRQVLTNIVLNGIQSMAHGGNLTVAIHTERLSPPVELGGPLASYACVSVQDEGCGIEPEAIARIFDPFYTTKRVGEGTGLGLSVSHGIVRDHGGWMQVESDPGRGSTFRIWLPEAAEEPCADAC